MRKIGKLKPTFDIKDESKYLEVDAKGWVKAIAWNMREIYE